MAQKDASVAELTKNFEDSTAVLLTEYRGLTVAELKELRNTIRQDAEYAVVKNTLTKIAAGQAGVTGLDADHTCPLSTSDACEDLTPFTTPCLSGAPQRWSDNEERQAE